MNLDHVATIQELDTLNMGGEIENLPSQLEAAWELGKTQPWEGFKQPHGFSRVLITGMGGSAIGADLVAAYIAPKCNLPVIVHRDYGLPAWAYGRETLVIPSSHSGNTEETLDSFEAALKADCSLLVLCTGGELEKRASFAGVPVWKFDHAGQPRAAVGFSFSLLLSALTRFGLITSPETELLGTAAAMRTQQETLGVDVPVSVNPAKRMAGQLVGRWVNVYGSGILAPVARRWKGQINELAKAGAGYEALPEADHNALAGLENPEALAQTITLFLRSPSDAPRNAQRFDLTRQVFIMAGLNSDVYHARGDSPLAHIWTTIHFGDYMAYYLAISYNVDPTPVAVLEDFKAEMKAVKKM
jgi:glucose/mannose-6-phosphate isomerase